MNVAELWVLLSLACLTFYAGGFVLADWIGARRARCFARHADQAIEVTR